MPTNKQKIHLRLAPESIHGTYGINYYFQTEGGIPPTGTIRNIRGLFR